MLLVEFLALGSINLVKSFKIKNVYYAFCAVTTAALAYILATQPVGNLLDNYVVFGAIPLSIVTISSIVTFPAAAVIIETAALTYRKTKNRRCCQSSPEWLS